MADFLPPSPDDVLVSRSVEFVPAAASQGWTSWVKGQASRSQAEKCSTAAEMALCSQIRSVLLLLTV